MLVNWELCTYESNPLINKALNSIDNEQRAEIEKQWMGLNIETGIAVSTIVKYGAVITLMALLFFIHHYRVTKEKMVLQKVTDELELYGRVFSEAHEGILIADANNIIVDVNPKFCDITGYSRDEAMGANPNILSSGKQSPEFYKNMWLSLDKDGYWSGEVWNRKKNGELYAELLTISALNNKQGQIKYYVGLFSDITQNKRQQEKLHGEFNSQVQHLS